MFLSSCQEGYSESITEIVFTHNYRREGILNWSQIMIDIGVRSRHLWLYLMVCCFLIYMTASSGLTWFSSHPIISLHPAISPHTFPCISCHCQWYQEHCRKHLILRFDQSPLVVIVGNSFHQTSLLVMGQMLVMAPCWSKQTLELQTLLNTASNLSFLIYLSKDRISSWKDSSSLLSKFPVLTQTG